MKVAFHVSPDPIFTPIREAILSVFPNGTQVSATPKATALITAADLLLLDATAVNAEAIYLLGIADALSKKSVLLMPIREQNSLLENRAAIIHAWNLDQLKRELRKLSTPAKAATNAPLDDTPAGKFHRLFGDLLVQHDYQHHGPIELENENVFTLREQDMDLPLAQEIARRAKSLNLRVRLL
jgi:hypothetical protein